MKIVTKFDIGQSVFYIHKIWNQRPARYRWEVVCREIKAIHVARGFLEEGKTELGDVIRYELGRYGSSLTREDDVFITEGEAKEECQYRNKIIKEKWNTSGVD